MRLILAIQAFFAILFARPLPQKLLPAPKEPADKQQERERLKGELAAAQEQRNGAQQRVEALEGEAAKARVERDELQEKLARVEERGAEALEQARREAGEAVAKVSALEEAGVKAREKLAEAREGGALALLSWLQREGRLVDFLMEGIDDYQDAEVGAAVRAIHAGCRKVLGQGFELAAVLPGEEESPVTVEAGFDPVAIQLTGNVKGDPPFKGRLMHHGWRTAKVAVPVPEEVDPRVIAPAEVEL